LGSLMSREGLQPKERLGNFHNGVRFALRQLKDKVMKSSILRRKSIELLKELIQILQEIIGSGDEESFRRLEETIRKLDDSRRRPSHIVH
jgi:hypothetical protein